MSACDYVNVRIVHLKVVPITYNRKFPFLPTELLQFYSLVSNVVYLSNS